MTPNKKAGSSTKHLKLNLQQVLIEKGVTRRDLSKKTGLNYVTISSMINENYKRVGLDTLAKICLALNVEVGELFVWE